MWVHTGREEWTTVRLQENTNSTLYMYIKLYTAEIFFILES